MEFVIPALIVIALLAMPGVYLLATHVKIIIVFRMENVHKVVLVDLILIHIIKLVTHVLINAPNAQALKYALNANQDITLS